MTSNYLIEIMGNVWKINYSNCCITFCIVFAHVSVLIGQAFITSYKYHAEQFKHGTIM